MGPDLAPKRTARSGGLDRAQAVPGGMRALELLCSPAATARGTCSQARDLVGCVSECADTQQGDRGQLCKHHLPPKITPPAHPTPYVITVTGALAL